MKTDKTKKLFEKFNVAELKRPEHIFGGDGDGTDDKNGGKVVCVSASTRYVIIKK